MKLTAETIIKSTPETVRYYTQTPELHARWDLRFTDIGPLDLPQNSESPKRFRYSTRIGFGIIIDGWGETIGDGNTSALKFGSNDPKSLILEGTGSWIYRTLDGDEEGVRFSTVYDYKTRYGLAGSTLDNLVFRPLMIWATRWSFSRLRLWIENGTAPEVSLNLWLAKIVARLCLACVWLWEGLIPKLISVHPSEVALVAHSGLYLFDPRLTLNTLGLIEVLFGLWLMAGRSERLTAALSAAGVVFLGGLVAVLQPESLGDPFGGIAKNLGLLGCSVTIWLLAPLAPNAQQEKS